MSVPIKWHGVNKVLTAPKDTTSEQVQDLPIFTNGAVCISRWKLTPETIEEINRTGCIFLSVYSGQTQPPVFIGSERETREVAVDYGPVWRVEN